MGILAIETSCDETAICLIESDGSYSFTVLGDALLSQVAIHREFGGVYPNMAKRAHAKNLVPLLTTVLTNAHALIPADTNQLPKECVEELRTLLSREPELFSHLMLFLAQHKRPDIDAIAVTHGPGLEPALWVGINFAKALAYVWNIPVIPVNHMEGHIFSSVIQSDGGHFTLPEIAFPALSLLISGGHTELVLIDGWGNYEVIGETRDDAVGEAFDKVARMLGLPYPGGPEISKLAKEAREQNLSLNEPLPRPMINTDDLDFSFSGLKTSVLYALKKQEKVDEILKQKMAREFEDAVSDVLIEKTKRALKKHGIKSLIIGGGVSANATLRERFRTLMQEEFPETALFVPKPSLTTDNALMIAVAGMVSGDRQENITAHGTLPLTQRK
jgi:N6-L-threonylcarbamoyladenine synthase